MATIILQTMPATESSGMVFYTPFAISIEIQQVKDIEQAYWVGKAMIERAKQSGKGATLMATVRGRNPRGWDKNKHTLKMNTFQ